MTNWEKIKEGITSLIDLQTPENFADWFSECASCEVCTISDYCDRKAFIYGSDGKPLLDEYGYKIHNDDSKGCYEILLDWLNEEVGPDGD